MIAATGLAGVLCIVLTVYWFILLIQVVVSWATLFGWRPPISGPVRTVLDVLDDVTMPVIRPLRALIPPLRAGAVGLDLSVLLAFVILFVLRTALGC